MNDKQEVVFALSPGDITVQIIPEWLESNDLVKLPEINEGYTIPLRKFFLEEVDKEFCGDARGNQVWRFCRRCLALHRHDSGRRSGRAGLTPERLLRESILQLYFEYPLDVGSAASD